jgi:hypothetical protein
MRIVQAEGERAGRLFSRAEMRRTEQAMERDGYPWPVRVPGGPRVCCTNYVGLISARSKKIQKHNFSFYSSASIHHRLTR